MVALDVGCLFNEALGLDFDNWLIAHVELAVISDVFLLVVYASLRHLILLTTGDL